MNRRNFLSLFSAGIAGIALEQAIPLGRVWSFPKEIVIGQGLTINLWWDKRMPIGSTVHIRLPQRFIVRDYFREHDQLTEILKVGDTFTVAGVNAVNPLRRLLDSGGEFGEALLID